MSSSSTDDSSVGREREIDRRQDAVGHIYWGKTDHAIGVKFGEGILY